MVSIRTVGDRFDNQSITIDQTSEDKSSSWSLQLVTNDLSQQILDSTNNVQAKIQVVDGNDLSGHTDPNSFLLPIELAGLVSTGNGKRKAYFRQRYDSKNQQRSPQLTLDGFVILNDGESQDYDNPFVMITLELQNTGSSSQQQNDDNRMDRQQFSGSQNDDATRDMSQRGPHTYRDEIANGGLDLAVTGSDDNRNQHESQRAPDLNRQDTHQDA